MSTSDAAMIQTNKRHSIIAVIVIGLTCVFASQPHAQAPRNIKVLLESRQTGTSSNETGLVVTATLQ